MYGGGGRRKKNVGGGSTKKVFRGVAEKTCEGGVSKKICEGGPRKNQICGGWLTIFFIPPPLDIKWNSPYQLRECRQTDGKTYIRRGV